MSPQFIEQIVQMLKRHSLAHFEFEQAGACLRLTLGGVSQTLEGASDIPRSALETQDVVLAPGMGILRLSHPQRDEPYIALGAHVEKGQVLAFLQNGVVLDEITAGRAGRVAAVLAAEGDLVGYAQPLFELQCVGAG
ncbi:acetyl-CoA carboxylase biotin carboxyl carrier protein [Pseudomonas sp. MWU13-2105]|uniref:acetyl-CoA carboxylase biotin carboxyl carrier protein n=1 Tax=Pseudomonas sp. MWU13-2105 TaxID=2935074 RepID=UPI00200C29A7|nr:acetyl-CoA carboxylase biotin carboxyl carrier protein subunit [Pseudomonas sp. MWU13-2105]